MVARDCSSVNGNEQQSYFSNLFFVFECRAHTIWFVCPMVIIVLVVLYIN